MKLIPTSGCSKRIVNIVQSNTIESIHDFELELFIQIERSQALNTAKHGFINSDG